LSEESSSLRGSKFLLFEVSMCVNFNQRNGRKARVAIANRRTKAESR
jgi:hypothetical protein